MKHRPTAPWPKVGLRSYIFRERLAVWVARREAFADFELWMFSMDSGDLWRPRSPNVTMTKAIELVGQAQFEDALVDP